MLDRVGCRYLPVLQPAKAWMVDRAGDRTLGWPHSCADTLVAAVRDLQVDVLDLRPVLAAAQAHGPLWELAESAPNWRGSFFIARAIAKEAGKSTDVGTALAPFSADVPIGHWGQGDLAALGKTNLEGDPVADADDDRWRIPVPFPDADIGEEHSRPWLGLLASSPQPWLAAHLSRAFGVVASQGDRPDSPEIELSGVRVLTHVLREADVIATASALG
jgi:hypothetical protein